MNLKKARLEKTMLITKRNTLIGIITLISICGAKLIVDKLNNFKKDEYIPNSKKDEDSILANRMCNKLNDPKSVIKISHFDINDKLNELILSNNDKVIVKKVIDKLNNQIANCENDILLDRLTQARKGILNGFFNISEDGRSVNGIFVD